MKISYQGFNGNLLLVLPLARKWPIQLQPFWFFYSNDSHFLGTEHLNVSVGSHTWGQYEGGGNQTVILMESSIKMVRNRRLLCKSKLEILLKRRIDHLNIFLISVRESHCFKEWVYIIGFMWRLCWVGWVQDRKEGGRELWHQNNIPGEKCWYPRFVEIETVRIWLCMGLGEFLMHTTKQMVV